MALLRASCILIGTVSPYAMALTLDQALRITEGAKQKALELGVPISVAVCDAGGRLVCFERMDGTLFASVYGAPGKATAAAAFARPTSALQERADLPIFRSIVAMDGGHMILAQGGVPLIKDGELIGAIGVSGASAQQDEDCANAGAAKL